MANTVKRIIGRDGRHGITYVVGILASHSSLGPLPFPQQAPLPSTFNSFSSFSLNTSTAPTSVQCTALNYVFIYPNLFSLCLAKPPPLLQRIKPSLLPCRQAFPLRLLPSTTFFTPTTVSSSMSWINDSVIFQKVVATSKIQKFQESFFFLSHRTPDIKSVGIGEKYHIQALWPTNSTRTT